MQYARVTASSSRASFQSAVWSSEKPFFKCLRLQWTKKKPLICTGKHVSIGSGRKQNSIPSTRTALYLPSGVLSNLAATPPMGTTFLFLLSKAMPKDFPVPDDDTTSHSLTLLITSPLNS